MTVLVVTHNREIARVADRVIELRAAGWSPTDRRPAVAPRSPICTGEGPVRRRSGSGGVARPPGALAAGRRDRADRGDRHRGVRRPGQHDRLAKSPTTRATRCCTPMICGSSLPKGARSRGSPCSTWRTGSRAWRRRRNDRSSRRRSTPRMVSRRSSTGRAARRRRRRRRAACGRSLRDGRAGAPAR